MNDEPMTPEQTADEARLTAQKLGKVLLPEMIDVLDEVIAQRLSSMRVWMEAWTAKDVDLKTWGRKICVMDATLAFLQRINDDPDARDYLVRRFRREAYETRKTSVDGGRDADASRSGGKGENDVRDR